MNKYQEYKKISTLLLESQIFKIFVESKRVLEIVNLRTFEQINTEEHALLKKIYDFNEKQIVLDKNFIEVDYKINNIFLNFIQNQNLKLMLNEFLTLENIMLYKKHILLIEDDLNITEISSRFFEKTNLDNLDGPDLQSVPVKQ